MFMILPIANRRNRNLKKTKKSKLFSLLLKLWGPYSQHFFLRNLQMGKLYQGRPFQPSLMFVGKAKSLPKWGAPKICSTQVASKPYLQTLH